MDMAHNVEVIIKEETNPSHGPNNATCPAAFDVRTVFSALPRDKRRDAPSDKKGNKEDNSCPTQVSVCSAWSCFDVVTLIIM